MLATLFSTKCKILCGFHLHAICIDLRWTMIYAGRQNLLSNMLCVRVSLLVLTATDAAGGSSHTEAVNVQLRASSVIPVPYLSVYPAAEAELLSRRWQVGISIASLSSPAQVYFHRNEQAIPLCSPERTYVSCGASNMRSRISIRRTRSREYSCTLYWLVNSEN